MFLNFTCVSIFLDHKTVSERVTGIEPVSEAWEASILPLNYTRLQTLEPSQFPEMTESALDLDRLQ